MRDERRPARQGSHRRLSRDVRARLSKTIEQYFDAVVERGLPERFRILLEQMDRSPQPAAANDQVAGDVPDPQST